MDLGNGTLVMNGRCYIDPSTAEIYAALNPLSLVDALP
eukprot:COSAG01_NODE_39412_length_477_cov_0.306878_1_plen_37_part_10